LKRDGDLKTMKVTVCGEDWAAILPAGHTYGDRVGGSSAAEISVTETVP
jgi:hypothetical protein